MLNMNSWIFENVADENYSNLTKTSSNKSLYDPEQPTNHRKRENKGREQRER